MTLQDIIVIARRKAGDVDPAAYRYLDTEWMQIIAAERTMLAVRKVQTLSQLTVDLTLGFETITPAPTDAQAVILAVASAVAVLEQTFRKRVDEGTIGSSWKSGLEEESTISQMNAYQGMVGELAKELEELIIIAGVLNTGFRKQ